MYDSKDKIVQAMFWAHMVLQHDRICCVDGVAHVPVSLDDLIKTIIEISGWDVTILEVDFVAESTHGRLERYDGKRAEIHIRSNLSVAEQRFVTAKELMHLVVDTNEDYSPYGDQIIDELVGRGLLGRYNMPNDVSRPSVSDVITEMAATEVLFPLQLRPNCLERVQRGETTYVALATEYDVPHDCVSRALNISYLDACDEAIVHAQSKIQNEKNT